MSRIKIETEQNIEVEYRVASIGDRILAWLIDFIILALYIVLITYVLIQFFGGWDYIDDVNVFFIIAYIPALLYHFLFELFFQGRTPGKFIMKTKVAMLDGSRPSVAAYLLRWLLRLIDMPFYGSVAVVSYLFSNKGQRVGDRAAGTTVLKLKPAEDYEKKLSVNLPQDHVIQFPSVHQLKDEHIRIIKEVLALPYGAKRNYLAANVSDKIKNFLQVESELPATQFLNAVVQDYYATFLAEEESGLN
ncbi:MAG: RDD family protein [Saprospiraceae bacterium]|nr:RDD family protein [Saprospiraceae bacterium]